jgi:hypothetical protein
VPADFKNKNKAVRLSVNQTAFIMYKNIPLPNMPPCTALLQVIYEKTTESRIIAKIKSPC